MSAVLIRFWIISQREQKVRNKDYAFFPLPLRKIVYNNKSLTFLEQLLHKNWLKQLLFFPWHIVKN